jgi:hypothetical protein
MIDSSKNFLDLKTRDSLFVRTASKPLPDNPELIGPEIASGKINLSKVSNIKLQIDDISPKVIDCSGGVAGDVSLKDIAANINSAFEDSIKEGVASVSSNRLVITSPTSTENSKIVLTAPGTKDATYELFGLQEYSWKKDGAKQTQAQAFGMVEAAVTADSTLSIGLGDGALVDVNILNGDNYAAIVEKINANVPGTAFTDGKHIVLMSGQDIRMAKTGTSEIFGSNSVFYSYVHLGSGQDTAAIEGENAISGAVSGTLRLKIDDTKAFNVVLDGEDSAIKVAKTINAAFKKATGKDKEIAGSSADGKLTLTSIKKGDKGRIVITSLPGATVAGDLLGTSLNLNSESEFLFPAEELFVATVGGATDFGATIGSSLADKSLRFSAGGLPIDISIADDANLTLENLIDTVFKVQSGLNHKLLVRYEGGEKFVSLTDSSLAEAPVLYFSIPLVAGVHLDDATRDAYARLFGDVDPFAGSPEITPNYTHEILRADNRPATTYTGDEPDFDTALPLSGGGQDRSSESKLLQITTEGLKVLNKVTGVSLLVLPGWETMSRETAKALINAGTEYCDKSRPVQARPLRDMFFIANTPKQVMGVTDAKSFALNEIGSSAGGYSALYYPWVQASDPIGESPVNVPPAGMLAGLYANIDDRRGVWKAPAGTEAGVAGVRRLNDQVSDIEQDFLNPHSVNAIRRMPGAGVVSWGARTLHTNPEWKYIPVRRTAIMIEVSIYENIQWAVFEPNNDQLWASLRLSIGSFMNGLFRSGAFQGTSSSDAYFVNCGLGDTMTQGDIDRGQVIVQVGFAPLKPAEFVIIRIQQKAGQEQ